MIKYPWMKSIKSIKKMAMKEISQFRMQKGEEEEKKKKKKMQ